MCNPALIFGTELAWAVDAAHPQDNCAQSENPRIVTNVLICRPFGATVRTVEIERRIFAHTLLQCPIRGYVALTLACYALVRQKLAINLVSGCKQDGRRRIKSTDAFQKSDSTRRV